MIMNSSDKYPEMVGLYIKDYLHALNVTDGDDPEIRNVHVTDKVEIFMDDLIVEHLQRDNAKRARKTEKKERQALTKIFH